MTKPLILYSAVSRLAYAIAQRYYGAHHYVWCAPCAVPDQFGLANPPSSDPLAIYWRFYEDIKGGDHHSTQIEANRRGLIRGASVKQSAGVIDEDTRKRIEAGVAQAPLSDFLPLLLVMPYSVVGAIAKPADVTNRARATSEEDIIEALPRSCFDVLELRK